MRDKLLNFQILYSLICSSKIADRVQSAHLITINFWQSYKPKMRCCQKLNWGTPVMESHTPEASNPEWTIMFLRGICSSTRTVQAIWICAFLNLLANQESIGQGSWTLTSRTPFNSVSIHILLQLCTHGQLHLRYNPASHQLILLGGSHHGHCPIDPWHRSKDSGTLPLRDCSIESAKSDGELIL